MIKFVDVVISQYFITALTKRTIRAYVRVWLPLLLVEGYIFFSILRQYIEFKVLNVCSVHNHIADDDDGKPLQLSPFIFMTGSGHMLSSKSISCQPLVKTDVHFHELSLTMRPSDETA